MRICSHDQPDHSEKPYLLNKRVELRACLICSLLQLLLSFVHILFYSLPVHLDIAAVVSDLERERDAINLLKSLAHIFMQSDVIIPATAEDRPRQQ